MTKCSCWTSYFHCARPLCPSTVGKQICESKNSKTQNSFCETQNLPCLLACVFPDIRLTTQSANGKYCICHLQKYFSSCVHERSENTLMSNIVWPEIGCWPNQSSFLYVNTISREGKHTHAYATVFLSLGPWNKDNPPPPPPQPQLLHPSTRRHIKNPERPSKITMVILEHPAQIETAESSKGHEPAPL